MLNFKVLYVISCLAVIAVTKKPYERYESIDRMRQSRVDKFLEAENVLRNSLNKLAEGDGPYYVIERIRFAAHEDVAGSFNIFDVDLIDPDYEVKNFLVTVWSGPWLKNRVQVTFASDGTETYIKYHDV